MDDNTNSNNQFYADDLNAEAIAENDRDDDLLVEDKEIPVTSGEMEIGNLDKDEMLTSGDENSYDEEQVPAGDNVDFRDDEITSSNETDNAEEINSDTNY